MYCLFVYKEFIANTNSNSGYDCSGYGNSNGNSNLTLSPYNMELLISGPDKHVVQFIQMLTTIFKMIATEHIDANYIRKAVIGYEDVTEVFPEDVNDLELFVRNPKFPGKLPNHVPLPTSEVVMFEAVEWEPIYEECLKRRVTLDVDVNVDIDFTSKPKPKLKPKPTLDGYEITPMYRYGDPDYVSYHARKYVTNHREYYNAIKEKVRLCAQGIADINHFLYGYIYGAWDVLFNEKLEIMSTTKEQVNYHYEKDSRQILKPAYETKVYKIDRQDVLNVIPSKHHLLCKINTKYVYTDNKTLTIYGKHRPYAYTTDKRLYTLNITSKM